MAYYFFTGGLGCGAGALTGGFDVGLPDILCIHFKF
jgi:hypothetical protein